MRKKNPWLSIVAFLLFFNGWVSNAFCVATDAPIGQTGQAGPTAFFPETVYDVGVALEGIDIKHDFIIQNRGAADLLIQNVKTS